MLLLTLFAAISWPTVISGFLGFMVCAAILLWVVWTKKKSDGNVIGDVSNKAKSLAGDAADKAKAGTESLKDGVSQLTGDDPTEDIADAVEAATGDAELPDVELPNIEVPNDVEPPAADLLDADVPEIELPEVEVPESIETAESIEPPNVESSTDDILSDENTFEIKDPLPTSDASIPNPTIPTPTLGAAVPPPRPQAPTQSSFSSSTPNPGTSASGIPPRGSSIPPRREPSTSQPTVQAAVTEPQAIVPEPDEIEVLDAPHIASFQSTGGATAAEQQELAELRLTLEASHNELTHLTTQRDQALSRAVQHEEELSQLRQQVENLSATSEALQQDRQKIAQLESEIETLRSQAASGDNEEAIRAIEKQHQATIEELRLIIGQREAAEASLSRERDNLAAQNDDLRRKVETGDAPQVDPNEFASLQMQHQQSASELSLSNETIRQLNQNLNQRDAQLMTLRNEVQSLTTKLAEAEQAATESESEPDAAVIEEIEAQHKATVNELRSIIEEREAEGAKLASEREKLSAEANELREKTIQLEEALAGAKDEAAHAASQESPEHSLANETIRQLNQNLTQRDAELFNLRRELQSAQTQLTAAEESDSSNDDSEQVTLLETKLQELEADRNRIRDEFASARERLHEELASAKDSEAGAKAESETSQRQVSEQAAVIEQLRDERRNRQDEIATLRAKVAESDDASVIEKLTAERDSALSRYDKLQIDLAHAVQDTSNNDDSREELELLKTKLAEKSAEFDAVQAEHHTLKARFTAETEALKGRLESLRDSSKENVAESNSEGESSDSLSNTTAKIAELETVIEQHEQYAAGLQTERQDLLDQLGASQEDINVKAAEMRRMREQLQAAQSQASTAAEQQSEFSASQSECRELSKSLEERAADLRRLQDEQIELKQQLAHFIDAEELWNTQRTSLYSRLGLDENGEPLDDESLHAAENGESERVEALTKLLAERDEAIEKLNERFQSLNEMYSSRDEASVLHDDASDPEDTLRAERDQAAASAAEASATIAKLMGELNDLKSNEVDANQISKLEEENREYRRSVAELHASVNELEELKLSRVREQESSRQKLMEAARANAELSTKLEELQAQTDQSNEGDEAKAPANAEELATLKKLASELKRERDEQRKTISELREEIEATPKDRKEGTKAVRDVKRLTTKIESQEKKLHDRDDRLQDLASELSKLRVEASALRNEVAEQKAVVRALNKGEDVPTPAKRRTTTKATKNGKPAKASKKTTTKKPATKKTTKRPAKTRPAAKSTKSKTATKKPASKPAKKVVAKDPTPRKKDPNLGMVYTKRPKSIDDLKEISGVGPVLEKRLNKAGIYQFSQVKDWGKKTIDYLDDELNLGGRIRREKWINQAKRLAK